MQNGLPRKKKSALLPVLLVGAVVLIAAAVVVVLLTGGGSVTGPWHSKALIQQLRFHTDNTVVIHSQTGIQEGTYYFDAKNGTGLITIDGKALPFTVSGDRLLLTGNGTENEFVRGEMDIKPGLTEATPSATPSPSDIPTEAPTPADTQTPQPTPTVKPTASPTLEPIVLQTTKPVISATFTPLVIKPTASIIVKPTGYPSLQTIVGTWLRVGKPDETLRFNSDETVVHTIPQSSQFAGEYTYNKATRKGTLYIQGREIDFTVSGDTLTLEDGTVFERE